MPSLAMRPLTRLEKGMLCAFFFVLLPAIGALVEYRSAFLTRRMGDLDCFLRAGWAVRTGTDIYAVTSDNDWHYNYPPLFAILMTPLADPPNGESADGFLPYPLSVAICFLLNVACMIAAAHFLASAFEETSNDSSFRSQPRFCARWWALRMLPVLVCLLPIGHTMMRGQVNLLILALLSATLASWMRGQSFRAGAWLSIAICIKVIPLYLLVFPAWKRDWRALAGCGVGMFVGLVLIPVLTFGPVRTGEYYQTYAQVFFGPILGLHDDESRKEEIVGVNATDSVGVKNAIHNWMYPTDGPRPEEMHPAGKIAYLVLGVAMTFVTLWPRGRSPHQFAGLIVLMTIFSPVCHSHYLMFCLPIVMSLLMSTWQWQPTLATPRWMTALFVAFWATMAIAYLPGLEILKDRCAALAPTLLLWAVPVWQMWRSRTARHAEPANSDVRAAA